MTQIINTNIQSINAQRNLSRSGVQLATSLQRLSSGLRINSAKDDAAGLAITERFSTQIRGLDVAIRNANDGISLAQTGEGALSEITLNLQRIRELAVQAANSTNSASDRSALDAEVQQRIAEVERIATQTSFNGLKVLDGTFGVSQFQVGANSGELIAFNLSQSVKSTSIGQIAYAQGNTQVDNTALIAGVRSTIGPSQVSAVAGSFNGALTRQTADSAFAKAVSFAGIPGLEVTAKTNVVLNVADVAATGNQGDTYNLRVNGVDIFSGLDIETSGVTSKQIVDAINNQSARTGVTAKLDSDPQDGHSLLLLSAADGRNIVIGETTDAAAAALTAGTFASGDPFTDFEGVRFFTGQIGTVDDVYLGKLVATVDSTTGVITTFEADGVTAFDESAATNRGYLTFSASDNISLDIANAAGADVALGFTADANSKVNIGRDVSTLASVSVTTVLNANDAIRRVDSALTTISSLRGALGAIQNRFETTITNLRTTSENLTASRSRILDTDFASETAALTRGQILQQAGVAILAQANQLPQNVLSLLR